jgi:hypothetical protein
MFLNEHFLIAKAQRICHGIYQLKSQKERAPTPRRRARERL